MYNRRQFLNKTLFVGGDIFLLSNKNPPGKQLNKVSVKGGALLSRVVQAVDMDVFDKDAISLKAVSQLLDHALEKLYNAHYADIWKKLFTKHDIVGLKVNCLAGRGLSTHIELVGAIVKRLEEVGIPSNHIIVWDRHDSDLKRAGFELYEGRSKTQCYGTNRVGFTRKLYEYGAAASLLSRILVEQCTAIINVPVLKDHGIVGMSGALKNNFGCIHNPNKYHDNIGDPYVADVNMFGPIRQKTRLIICDCLQPQYEGGPPYMPQWTWKMGGLLVATDPVALDQTGLNIIEEKRKELDFPTLAQAGREPVYIATAADRQHQLGTNDINKIELVHV